MALHHLTAGELRGELETSLEPGGQLFEGDYDYALRCLLEDGPPAAAAHPELVERVRMLLAGWETAGPERLQRLMGVLGELEQVTGRSLPYPLPPGVE